MGSLGFYFPSLQETRWGLRILIDEIRRGPIVAVSPGCMGRPLVLVHGGAGRWAGLEREDSVVDAARRAVEAGLRGENNIDMVVEATRVLEDSGVFNAGIGSTLTFTGRVEMDAGLMVSSTRGAGVAAVTYPRNPIILARLVLERTNHVLVVGPAADALAERFGLEKHPGPSERALERWRRLRRELAEGRGPSWARKVAELYGGDTVGAVVLDPEGRLAAATSTGGVSLKLEGRVGDSAIPGAGFYVDDEAGACAATGIGETIILGRPCTYAVELLSSGVPVLEAAFTAVARHTRLFGANNLGLILVDVEGCAAAAMNTEAMPVALGSPDKNIVSFFMKRNTTEARGKI